MTRRLVVADDARIIRELIKDAACSGGWEIVGEATNGEEAARRYWELRPDAMTLDLVMPHSDGLHGLDAIVPLVPDARILVISALEDNSIKQQALARGARAFLAKPFKSTELLNALELLVRS